MTSSCEHSTPGLQTTALAEEHRALGARMLEFAGWLMPIRYRPGIVAEHEHTRRKVSLFDTCHMGEIRVRGTSAAEQLERLLPRPVRDQPVGACRYNFLLSRAGAVLDDVLVYRIGQDEFYLVTNAGNTASDAQWLRSRLGAEVQVADESLQTGKLDLQGPAAADVLAACGLAPESLPPYFAWRNCSLLGHRIMLSRTGYTGELGVEIYCAAEAIAPIWCALLACDPVQPAGLGARDTLRLEMGYPLSGHEWDGDTTPVEAGFGRLVHAQNREFPGAAHLRLPPAKRLVGLLLAGRQAARPGAQVRSALNGRIGTVTSGCYAPSLKRAVALAYIDGAEMPAEGMKVSVGGRRGRTLEASVARLPLYGGGTARCLL